MCSWPEYLHSQNVSRQAWRSSLFSCSLCWVLPEYIDMKLRFASALDLPANQGTGGPPQPSLDQLGQDSSAEAEQERSLDTASF